MQKTSFWDPSPIQLSTPEQIDLQLELGHIGSRGLAILFDFALRYSLLILFYFIAALTTNLQQLSSELDLGVQSYLLFFVLFFFSVEWFYFTLFEWLWNGQTPGKRLLHLRVIQADGSPVTWSEIVLRNFFRPLDTTGPMALIGMAFIFFHPRRQRLGDLVGHTLVVRETPIDWEMILHASPPSQEQLVRQQPHQWLTPPEWELLHRYLQRASKLDPPIRKQRAQQIRHVLEPRLNLPSSHLTDEQWLKNLGQSL